MILIFTNSNEYTTDEVINWLLFKPSHFVRINNDTKGLKATVSIDQTSCKFTLEIQGKNNPIVVRFDQIDTYWYRRGGYNIVSYIIERQTKSQIRKSINNYIEKEVSSMQELIHSILRTSTRGIGNIAHNKLSKTQVLLLAQSVGLNIPITLLTNDENSADDFLSRHAFVITKAITNMSIQVNSNMSLGGPTITFQEKQSPLNPALFQEKIDKAYELRIFYLDGQCYPMAIFSQLDEQTSIDFRKYNFSKPNRTPPYKLPDEISHKIERLMSKLNMNCGSIDMVVTKQKEYVFLEVNPIGQFKQVSLPCNFYLEQKIANFLNYG